MITKVKETISKYQLIEQGKTVTVALSGGADSVALLCVLKEIGYDVTALHINHGIRGAESDRDEQFCIDLCNKKDIPIKISHLNLKHSSEDEMRKLRYEIFSKEKLLATAHHIEDNTETVLMNIIRGTSTTGLCGIPPKRENIIRPLICCSRKQIEEYLKSINQPFCIDSTNGDNTYTRNLFRNSIIPQLKNVNPSLDSAIFNMSESLREDYDKTELMVSIKRDLADRSIEYDFEKLNRIYDFINNSNGILQLSKDYLLKSNNKEYSIIESQKEEKIELVENISLEPQRIILSNGISLEFKKLSLEEIKKFINSQLKEYKNCLDCDKIKGTVSIRSWQKGEHFKMLKRPDKLLSDIFSENHIPPYKRTGIPIITKYDKPVWIENLGVTDKYSISSESKNVIHITVGRE